MVRRSVHAMLGAVAATAAACTVFWPIEDHALRGSDAGEDAGEDVLANDVEASAEAGDAADVPDASDASDAGSTFEVETFASLGSSPRLLAMNATHVFVIGLDEKIERVNKSTRAVEPHRTPLTGINGGLLAFTGIAADTQWVFLGANEPGSCGVPATAWRVGVTDSGVPQELSGGRCRRTTAVASDELDFVFAVDDRLFAYGLLGGGTRVLATGLPTMQGLVSRVDEVYLASALGKRIVRVLKSADAGVDLALTASAPSDLVADDDNVYWIEVDGLVASKPRAAVMSDPSVTLAQTVPGLVHLAQDATHLYFTNLVAGTVGRLPKAGGAILDVATGQAQPLDIAADGSGVYWVNRAGATLMRATRK